MSKRMPQHVLTYIFDNISDVKDLSEEELRALISEKVKEYNSSDNNLDRNNEFQDS